MSHYIQYYDEQIGGGGVKSYYVGSRYQRGNGVGAWLGGLLRRVLPYVASGAKAVGKEALRAGVRVVGDVANNGANFKEALASRARESRQTLKRKAADKLSEMMKGEGYKLRALKRARQSRKKRASGRIVTKNKKKRKKRPVRKNTTTPIKRKVKKRKIVHKRVGAKKNRKKITTYRDINDIFGPK